MMKLQINMKQTLSSLADIPEEFSRVELRNFAGREAGTKEELPARGGLSWRSISAAMPRLGGSLALPDY